jgi:hypothetical protein
MSCQVVAAMVCMTVLPLYDFSDVAEAYSPGELHSNIVIFHYSRANNNHTCYSAMESLKASLWLCCGWSVKVAWSQACPQLDMA